MNNSSDITKSEIKSITIDQAVFAFSKEEKMVENDDFIVSRAGDPNLWQFYIEDEDTCLIINLEDQNMINLFLKYKDEYERLTN